MKTSANGRRLIETFESCILQAYDDANDHIVRPGEAVRGTLTIGYGHTSAAGAPRVYVGQVITQGEADAILSSDLASVELEVMHLVRVPLNQSQFDALVSFHYNTGAIARATLTKRHRQGDYADAKAEFGKWIRAGGKILPGLMKRRAAEAELYATDLV